MVPYHDFVSSVQLKYELYTASLLLLILLIRDPAILDGLDLTEEERNVLIDNINRRLTPQAVKIRAGTETTMFCTLYIQYIAEQLISVT